MKLLTTATLFILFNCADAYAQTCNCNQELTDVKNKIEKNYAGYQDKVNNKTRKAYDQHNKLALQQSKSITNPAYCLYLINDWLRFFKDGHIQIGRDRISKEKEKVDLQKRISNIESLKLPELTEIRGANGIVGIYGDKDSIFRIALIKSKNTFREYAGVVISSKSDKWLPGQVMLELKSGKDTLNGIMYDKFYIPLTVSLPVTENSLGSWQREETERFIPEVVNEAAVAGKLLSEKTLYLKISSFNQNNARNIDSLFKANKTNLNRIPNLILDLRNNGGGADFSYKPILPYLYTNTFKTIGADVQATDDNIAGWAGVATTDGLPADQKTFINEVIDKMKRNKGTLVSFAEDQTSTFDSVITYPKKIIILINRQCGSTTEEFLLLAKQSTKVTLMGQQTAGVLDYANMRGAEFSGIPYMLYWATSRSRRIDQGMAIDNVGIKPQKTLKLEQDWVKEAQSDLED
ncbi:S41 family peptidase [Pedobacter sp. FW305-3-2-15-E-R2A2]|uniref:S41 family peptidase n=1 Tax=Pedobacter sp. FW305-3-2-15-E-R2A2 TaxID=3140251 RepID=UPI0031409982